MNIERNDDDDKTLHFELIRILEGALSLADDLQLSMAAIHINSAIEDLRQGMNSNTRF